METRTPVQTEAAPQKKSNLPLILGIVAGILVCCCVLGVAAYFLAGSLLPNWSDDVPPVYNDADGYTGNADELLRTDALNLIGIYEELQLGCADLSLVSGEMLVFPDPAGDGSWQETWQVDACGDLRQYTVSFTPTSGGTDIAVTFVK
ncbi:MAG: hypothetical protein HY869_10180 [Chloroflexi bacterium]|nr:hypothetical protein [Chloroflexota bacterium]